MIRYYLTILRCLLNLSPKWQLDRCTNDLNSSLRNSTTSFFSSILSVAKISTFLVRPPNVTISAFKGLNRNDFRVWMSSVLRSDRSSQQKEAFITSDDWWFLLKKKSVTTITSSVSEGNEDSSCIMCEDCCFSSFTCSTTFASSEALSVCTIIQQMIV